VSVVYDVGVLSAADRNDRRTWLAHELRADQGIIPLTTAPVVAQVSRSARQTNLRRFLRGCEVVAFTPAEASAVGALLESSGTADAIDAHLVVVAARAGATVITADAEDLALLSSHLQNAVPVVRM
jgi:hypothetical protein